MYDKKKGVPDFPISTLVSGKDILLFWIAKMVFMCYFFKGQLPFKQIFLHGLILDSQRRKMSKSLDNGVDPRDLIGQPLDDTRIVSHDALRLFFLSNTHDANDIVFSKDKLKYFCNTLHKFEQAYEFYKKEEKENVSDEEDGSETLHTFYPHECVFLQELKSAIYELSANLREFNFAKAVDRALIFFKDCFCNRYLTTYKLFRKKGFHYFPLFRNAWWMMMDMFEILVPDFFDSLRTDFDRNIEKGIVDYGGTGDKVVVSRFS